MLRFADSFEHYGTGATGNANMLRGAWSNIISGAGVTVAINNTTGRTGTSSLMFAGGITNSQSSARFNIAGAAIVVAGFGFGLQFPNLPSTNDNNYFQFRDNANNPIITLCFQSDGSISIRRGGIAGTLLAASDSVITAGTFHHIEFKVTVDTVVGEFEMRVNGITLLQLTNINLSALPVANGVFGRNSDVQAATMFIDDVVVWDDQGTYNNDFLGPVRVMTLYASGDGVPQDWTPVGAGTAYQAINQTVPDDDTSYIGTDVINEVATLTLPTLPPEVATVTGVYIPALSRIDAAGVGELLVSMVSVAAELMGGSSTPLTPSYTYWPFTFDYDPNANAYWTKSTFEAAKVKIKKTA